MRIDEPILLFRELTCQGGKMASNLDINDEDYPLITAAITQIFIQANCPDSHRQFIFCLIGMANKSIQLDASDNRIASYARGNIKSGNVHADRGWARDKRRALVEWQDKGNLELVKCEVQDFDPKTKRRAPTKYTLNVLRFAEQVVEKAKQNKLLWSMGTAPAISDAANKLVTHLLGQQVNTPKEQNIDPPSEVRTMLKTATTNIKKAAEMLKKHDFQLMREDEKLVEEVEKYIKKIRDRGFVDDKWEAKIFSGIKRDKKP
jgi:hypothetical protein